MSLSLSEYNIDSTGASMKPGTSASPATAGVRPASTSTASSGGIPEGWITKQLLSSPDAFDGLTSDSDSDESVGG